MFVTFDPFIQFSQTRYHWNPWEKPAHTTLTLCCRFAPWWIFQHLSFYQKPAKCISYQKCCQIFSKLGTDDWPFCQIHSQTCQTGSKPILSKPLTYHSQTWYIDSWHHPGDTQAIWWPFNLRNLTPGIELVSLQGFHVSEPNLGHSLMNILMKSK